MLPSLRLQNFRCFDELSLEVPASGIIITGDNAQGKTSILEAACMLVRLHSPRTSRFQTLTKFSTGGFGIAGDPFGERRKILHRENILKLFAKGEPVPRRSDYLNTGGLIVWMGNEDLGLVRGSGENRRNFLDFIGSQIFPEYRSALTRYKRALRAKNLLLKEPVLRTAELRAWEEIFVENGNSLMKFRAELIAALAPLSAEAQERISAKDEKLSLSYLPGSGPSFGDSILQARSREIRARHALIGPHRDDLSIRLHGLSALDYASEGQQRTIAISLKLAQGRSS